MRSVILFMSALVLSLFLVPVAEAGHYGETIIIDRGSPPPFVFNDRFGFRTTTVVSGNRTFFVEQPTNDVFFERVRRPRPQVIFINGRPFIVR